MTEEKTMTMAVKYYHLTPKAYRHVLAMKEYEKKLEELSKLSDEEIMKFIEEKGC